MSKQVDEQIKEVAQVRCVTEVGAKSCMAVATNQPGFSACQFNLRLLLRRQKGQGSPEGLAATSLAKRAKYLVALPK